MAAGNEPFRLGNYSFHQTGQTAQVMYMETVEPSLLQPRARTCEQILCVNSNVYVHKKANLVFLEQQSQ